MAICHRCEVSHESWRALCIYYTRLRSRLGYKTADVTETHAANCSGNHQPNCSQVRTS